MFNRQLAFWWVKSGCWHGYIKKISLELGMICINNSSPPTDTDCLTNENNQDFNIVAIYL